VAPAPSSRTHGLDLSYVLIHNAALGGIALTASLVNLGFGILLIAVPVMVLQRLHGNPALVGGLWAIFGLASVPSALIAGRVSSEGRERLVMIVSDALFGLAVVLLAFAGDAWVVAATLLIAGLANGPFDVSMPAWFGGLFPAEPAGTISTESARQSRRDRPVEESPSSAEQGAG